MAELKRNPEVVPSSELHQPEYTQNLENSNLEHNVGAHNPDAIGDQQSASVDNFGQANQAAVQEINSANTASEIPAVSAQQAKDTLNGLLIEPLNLSQSAKDLEAILGYSNTVENDL